MKNPTTGANLLARAAHWSDRIAIVSNGQHYTYGTLLEKATNVASNLLEGKADLAEERICFLVHPSFNYTAIQWGIWKAGGIAVPLCVLHPLPSLQYVIENTKATILVVEQEYVDLLSPLAQERNIRLHTVEEILKVTTRATVFPEINPERRAMILYTSGTTSLPKGVVTTHANITFQIKTLVEAWGWNINDHILNILPLHHVHGIINVMSCALWTGACCEFLPKFDAQKVWDNFVQKNTNVFMAVPTIYYKLIDYWDQASNDKKHEYSDALKKFRLMISGSAALPVPVLKKWRDISGYTLLERYGMTEIGMALSNPYSGERRAGHVGQPLPGVDIRLINETGLVTEEQVAGEIQIKGPNVFKEYWEKPTATAEAFTADGWFKSGDIAILNDGYYKILGRDSVDIIKSGGYKISALEIEDVLRKHTAIADCAVVGIPSSEWGELVVACLVLNEGKEAPDTKTLNNWLKEVLPAYKIPRQYVVKTDLPRNVLGKVTKNTVKDFF